MNLYIIIACAVIFLIITVSLIFLSNRENNSNYPVHNDLFEEKNNDFGFLLINREGNALKQSDLLPNIDEKIQTKFDTAKNKIASAKLLRMASDKYLHDEMEKSFKKQNQ